MAATVSIDARSVSCPACGTGEEFLNLDLEGGPEERHHMLSQTRGVIRSRFGISLAKCTIELRRSFISNLFGKKVLSKRDDIIKNQDNYETSPDTRITILSELNAPGHKEFDPLVDMPRFKVFQWKNCLVKAEDIETQHTSESVKNILKDAYESVYGIAVTDTFKCDLYDLNRRFQVTKIAQSNLGFDLNDSTVSSCHLLDSLASNIMQMVKKRYVSERNPNGIVVRREDFSAPNIYLNSERTPGQQSLLLAQLVEQSGGV